MVYVLSARQITQTAPADQPMTPTLPGILMTYTGYIWTVASRARKRSRKHFRYTYIFANPSPRHTAIKYDIFPNTVRFLHGFVAPPRQVSSLARANAGRRHRPTVLFASLVPPLGSQMGVTWGHHETRPGHIPPPSLLTSSPSPI